MSGGRRLDDHSFWAGKGSEYPLPLGGGKMKREAHAEGAGHEMDYQDTNEAIVRDQKMGDSKAKSQKMKPGYRY